MKESGSRRNSTSPKRGSRKSGQRAGILTELGGGKGWNVSFCPGRGDWDQEWGINLRTCHQRYHWVSTIIWREEVGVVYVSPTDVVSSWPKKQQDPVFITQFPFALRICFLPQVGQILSAMEERGDRPEGVKEVASKLPYCSPFLPLSLPPI